jgi:hypothetical protein
LTSSTSTTFLASHVDRGFRQREERPGNIVGARSVSITPIDTGLGLLGVEHQWISPSGAPPFVSFGAITDVRSELARLMTDSRVTAYSSDEPFNPNLFRPYSFSHVDLTFLLSLCELRHAALLAADMVAFNAQSPGLREALLAHSPKDDQPDGLPAMLRLILTASVGYAPPSTATASAPLEGVVTSSFGHGGVGGAHDVDFTRRMINGLRRDTFR